MELRLISIKAEDIESLVNFYNELFGRPPDRVDDGRLVEYEFGDTLFGVYDPSRDFNEPEFKRGSNCTPAFKVNDIDEQERELPTEATIVQRKEKNEHKWFIIEDPEGNQIEFYSTGG